MADRYVTIKVTDELAEVLGLLVEYANTREDIDRSTLPIGERTVTEANVVSHAVGEYLLGVYPVLPPAIQARAQEILTRVHATYAEVTARGEYFIQAQVIEKSAEVVG